MVAVQVQRIGCDRCRLRLSKDHGCWTGCWRGPKDDEKDQGGDARHRGLERARLDTLKPARPRNELTGNTVMTAVEVTVVVDGCIEVVVGGVVEVAVAIDKAKKKQFRGNWSWF